MFVVERINTQGMPKNGEWRMVGSGLLPLREQEQRMHTKKHTRVASLRGDNKKAPRGILKIYKIGCIRRHERGKNQRNRRVWSTPIESVDYLALALLPMDPIDPMNPMEPLFVGCSNTVFSGTLNLPLVAVTTPIMDR